MLYYTPFWPLGYDWRNGLHFPACLRETSGQTGRMLGNTVEAVYSGEAAGCILVGVFLLRCSHVSPVLPQRAGRSRLYAEGKGVKRVYQEDEKFRWKKRFEPASGLRSRVREAMWRPKRGRYGQCAVSCSDHHVSWLQVSHFLVPFLSHHSFSEIIVFPFLSRNLTQWDNRLALLILLGSPQMINTPDTESPSRDASKCS